MCKELRDKWGIPDELIKDTHVTNWFKKNLSQDVLAVFRHPDDVRGTLTKDGFSNLPVCGLTIVTKSGAINIDSAEPVFFEKVKV